MGRSLESLLAWIVEFPSRDHATLGAEPSASIPIWARGESSASGRTRSPDPLSEGERRCAGAVSPISRTRLRVEPPPRREEGRDQRPISALDNLTSQRFRK